MMLSHKKLQKKKIGYNIIKDYPVSNPGLNPIEHVLNLLKPYVAKRNPSNKEEIEAFSL